MFIDKTIFRIRIIHSDPANTGNLKNILIPLSRTQVTIEKKKIIFNICKISICFFSKCQVGYGIKSRIRPVPNPHYRFSEPCYVVCTAPQALGLRPSPPNPRRVQKTGRKSRGESVLSQAEATKSGQPSQGTPRQEKGCGEEAGPQQERPHR